MFSYRSHTQACSSHLFNCDWIKQAAKASHDLWNYKLWTINVYLSQHVLNALFSCWRIFHQLNFEPTWLVVNCSRFLLNDQEITAVSWFYGLWKYQFTCAHCRSHLGTAVFVRFLPFAPLGRQTDIFLKANKFRNVPFKKTFTWGEHVWTRVGQ